MYVNVLWKMYMRNLPSYIYIHIYILITCTFYHCKLVWSRECVKTMYATEKFARVSPYPNEAIGNVCIFMIFYRILFCEIIVYIMTWYPDAHILKVNNKDAFDKKICSTKLAIIDEPLIFYYGDVMISAVASHFTSVSFVCSTVSSGEDKRKHQSSASLAFVRGIHRGPVDSPHKGLVTRKCFHLMTSPCTLND